MVNPNPPTATFCRLKDGSWGLRTTEPHLEPGDTVQAVRKDGTRSMKVLGTLQASFREADLWSINDNTEPLQDVCSLELEPPAPTPEPEDHPREICVACCHDVYPGTECWARTPRGWQLLGTH